MGLIRFILIIFLIYYFFQLLFSYVLPFLLKRYISHKQNGYYNHNTHSHNKSNGKINIDYTPPVNNKKAKKEDIGEYVDFEEIKK